MFEAIFEIHYPDGKMQCYTGSSETCKSIIDEIIADMEKEAIVKVFVNTKAETEE